MGHYLPRVIIMVKRTRNDPCPVDITLDGVQVKHIVEADDELGYVKRWVTDTSGAFVGDPNVPGILLTETVYGKVVITPRVQNTPVGQVTHTR